MGFVSLRGQLPALALVTALALSACSGDSDPPPPAEAAAPPAAAETEPAPEAPASEPGSTDGSASEPDSTTTSTGTGTGTGTSTSTSTSEYGPGPPVPSGPIETAAADELDAMFGDLSNAIEPEALRRIGESGDPRLAWLVSDLLRFIASSRAVTALSETYALLTGTTLDTTGGAAWTEMTNTLIAWDIPAPPGYTDYKRQLYAFVEPGWAPFFADPASDIDWRLITWGGVFIDDRELGDLAGCARGCIPALDDPTVTGAGEGDWYPDASTVFGLEVDGEARAYPRNMMEVHEMVNDTIGGRRIGMPYCTLCGSAQAYFTDTSDQDVVLRTSGLLSRSNKVMYDLGTKSVFDTFTGRALSGPLREQGVQLPELTVITATWGEWKAAHPNTTILAQDGGVGRVYAADPLGGRDDAGPIFPIGDADPRLAVHDAVVGVIRPDGQAVAFPAGPARLTLDGRGDVEHAGVRLLAAGGGLVAETVAGESLVSHQSFWFAWSQFHPDTELWLGSAP